MAQTKQASSINFAKQIISLNAQLLNVYAQILPALAANTDEAYMTTVAALPTGALNADGTVGTADGSPNVAHPITAPVSDPLNKSSNQIATAMQVLTDFKSFMENVAVSAGSRRAWGQDVQ